MAETSLLEAESWEQQQPSPPKFAATDAARHAHTA